jgi:hypothetical protein
MAQDVLAWMGAALVWLFDWVATVLRDSGATLIGIGGLLVATITLWLSYRERTKEMRQSLFDRRVDASIALAKSAFAAKHTAMATVYVVLLNDAKPQPDDAWESARSDRKKFFYLGERWSVILSAEAATAMEGLVGAIGVVVGSSGGTDPPDASSTAVAAMDGAYQHFITALRRMIGVDRLSAETLAVLGTAR